MIRFGRHPSSVKIFALTVFILQFLFINNVFSTTIVTDKDREEMKLILKNLDVNVEHGEKIDISNQYKLWFFATTELDNRPNMHNFTFYTVLADPKGNVLDKIIERKKYDRLIYDIYPARDVPYYDLNGQGALAYTLHVVFGRPSPGEPPEPRINGVSKEYTKLSLFVIEKEKIKKVLNDFTRSITLDTLSKDKCSNGRKRRTEHVRSKEPFLSDQQTNGYFDFDVKVHDYFRDSCNSNNNEKSTEVYKFDGNVYRNANTAAVNVDKAVLFDTPDPKKPSKMYLVKGIALYTTQSSAA